MPSVKVFLLFLLLIHLKYSSGARRRKLILEIFETKCHRFTKLILQYECKFWNIDRNTYSFSNKLILEREVKNPLEIRLRIDVLQLRAKRPTNVIDVRIDGCKALQTAFDFAIFRALVNELRRTSNIPYKCPFAACKLYTVENFTVSSQILPAYTPDLNFTFTVEYFENSLLFADQLVHGRVFTDTTKGF